VAKMKLILTILIQISSKTKISKTKINSE